MRLPAPLLLHATIAAVVVFGCSTGDGPFFGPGTSPRIAFEVVASPTSAATGETVTITATAKNLGPGTLVYRSGCVTQGIDLRYDDPEDRSVSTRCDACPQRACPTCLDRAVRMRPGEKLVVTYVFDGRLADCSEMFLGPSGAYAAEATFSATVERTGAEISLTQRAPFRWTATAP